MKQLADEATIEIDDDLEDMMSMKRKKHQRGNITNQIVGIRKQVLEMGRKESLAKGSIKKVGSVALSETQKPLQPRPTDISVVSDQTEAEEGLKIKFHPNSGAY